jgi:hypothetical protein
MQPSSTFETPAQISGAGDAIPHIGYIQARCFDSPYFDSFYTHAGERRWWREEFACGHDVMLDIPKRAYSPVATTGVERDPAIT